jgi:hypothetical protein
MKSLEGVVYKDFNVIENFYFQDGANYRGWDWTKGRGTIKQNTDYLFRGCAESIYKIINSALAFIF